MELPKELLRAYNIAPKPAKAQPKRERVPMYRTFPVMLIFDDGDTENMELTAPNKPYWGGQLESEIMREWNRNPLHEHKVVRVKVFRNTREGGIMIDNEHGRVINVY